MRLYRDLLGNPKGKFLYLQKWEQDTNDVKLKGCATKYLVEGAVIFVQAGELAALLQENFAVFKGQRQIN